MRCRVDYRGVCIVTVNIGEKSNDNCIALRMVVVDVVMVMVVVVETVVIMVIMIVVAWVVVLTEIGC